mmetsp:Transcript_62635/g.174588  ORF Transcript_62635/g.174588 Transcript_62635/m.174588 type:complete len:84 (-) Transcript_62635:392-643(-)
MQSQGAPVELIPRKIAKAKGQGERGGGPNTRKREDGRRENKATAKEVEGIRATSAAKPAGDMRRETRADAPSIEPGSKQVGHK